MPFSLVSLILAPLHVFETQSVTSVRGVGVQQKLTGVRKGLVGRSPSYLASTTSSKIGLTRFMWASIHHHLIVSLWTELHWIWRELIIYPITYKNFGRRGPSANVCGHFCNNQYSSSSKIANTIFAQARRWDVGHACASFEFKWNLRFNLKGLKHARGHSLSASSVPIDWQALLVF